MKKEWIFADRILMIALLLFIVWGSAALARADENTAVVTAIDGKAHVYTKGSKKGMLLRKNDHIYKQQEIRVGERSRVEVRFPDGTIMRFAEQSRVKMEDYSFDPKTGNKKIKVDMEGGKLWSNVKRLVTADSRVEVKTVNAVAGVRGTVYRVNVDQDNSAMVKVYDGSVYVDGTQKQSPQGTTPVSQPVQVAGPHEVPKPYHEVTMEEWHVIVKSFQQVTISPQGVATEPKDFDPKADQDDWVRWNQERDRQVQRDSP